VKKQLLITALVIGVFLVAVARSVDESQAQVENNSSYMDGVISDCYGHIYTAPDGTMAMEAFNSCLETYGVYYNDRSYDERKYTGKTGGFELSPVASPLEEKLSNLPFEHLYLEQLGEVPRPIVATQPLPEVQEIPIYISPSNSGSKDSDKVRRRSKPIYFPR